MTTWIREKPCQSKHKNNTVTIAGFLDLFSVRRGVPLFFTDIGPLFRLRMHTLSSPIVKQKLFFVFTFLMLNF